LILANRERSWPVSQGITIMNMTRFFAAVAATAITFVIATAATAEPTRTAVPVSYADLDLQSFAGQATLARRIGAAAVDACDVDPNVRDYRLKLDAERCFTAAVTRANLVIASADTLVVASR
jgi:UrcA family protein